MRTRRACACCLLLVATVSAQRLVWTQTGIQTAGIGGFSARLGDRNGDGFDDFMTMVAVRTPPAWTVRIESWPVSGLDGSFLPGGARQTPPLYYDGTLVRAGDMDGDGVSEYAAMAINQSTATPILEVRSGRYDALLWTVTDRWFGRPLCGDLDVNGDGYPDLLIGSPWFRIGSQPAVGCLWAFDHLGGLIYQRIGTDPLFLIGGTMAKLGDVDADGCDDFAMAVYMTPSGSFDPGFVDVVSGRTGQTIRRVQGAQPGDRIAGGIDQPLAGTGDLDGDDVPDFIAGGGTYARGTVQVFSTATGQLLHAWYSGGWNDGFGEYVAGGIDFDRDGIPDILASEPNGSNQRGTLHVWSGRDWTELLSFTDPTSIAGPGMAYLMTMPPQPGDVFPRFVVAGPAWRSAAGPFQGRHYLFSGAPIGVAQVGAGCIGTLGREPRMGIHDLGSQGVRVTVTGGDPGSGGILVVGGSLAQPAPVINLHALGFTGCTLHPLPQAWGFLVLDPTGYGYHRFRRPISAAGTGLQAFGQWVVLGSGAGFPGAASDAMRWSMQ